MTGSGIRFFFRTNLIRSINPNYLIYPQLHFCDTLATAIVCFHHVTRAWTETCRAAVMSAVKNYFTLTEERSKNAECSICRMSVSRGGSRTGHFNTRNLIKHLQKHHRKEYRDCFTIECKEKRTAATIVAGNTTEECKTPSREHQDQNKNRKK